MFRDQRKKWLFQDLIPDGEGPWVYESDEILSIFRESLGVDGRMKIDNFHAQTDITYLIYNEYDVDVSVQPIGGVYNNVNDLWIMKVNLGTPTVVPAGEYGYIDVFPGEPYMQDYTVELTYAELGQGQAGCDVLAIFVIDQ